MSRPPHAAPTARTGLPGRVTHAEAFPPLCKCSVATLSSPTGDVVVLRVAGEVDGTSLPVLDAALDEVLDRRPDHLVVDLSASTFCDVRGLTAFANAARAAARDGTGYGIGGASPLFVRLWPLFWPDREAPRLYRTTATAVLAAFRLLPAGAPPPAALPEAGTGGVDRVPPALRVPRPATHAEAPADALGADVQP